MGPAWPDAPVSVRVPATSANLGPGFDSFGLALGLHDVVRAQVISGGLRIEVSGTGAMTEGDGDGHLVVRAMRAAFELLGVRPPGLGLCCANAIPHGFGLGSSAAAIVAGILAARALGGEAALRRLPDPAVLGLASELEGHADNVAACLAGGLTIAWTADLVRSVRLDPLPELTPVLCLPSVPLATEAARRLLPATVPHADAARNAARSALLIAALTQGRLADLSVLLEASTDYLHQPYRAGSMPQTSDLITALRAGSVPAVVSGAGPAVLALTLPGVTAGPDAVAAIASGSGSGWTVSVLDVDRQGAVVS